MKISVSQMHPEPGQGSSLDKLFDPGAVSLLLHEEKPGSRLLQLRSGPTGQEAGGGGVSSSASIGLQEEGGT